jgi:hypothetical protein
MVVLIYKGNELGDTDSTQLKWCVESTRKHSPDSRIIRLGDPTSIKGICEFYPEEDYHRTYDDFVKNYEHHCELPDFCVFRSVGRWMMFRDFCREKGIDEFFTMDCDVMVFCNLEEENKRYFSPYLSCMNPNRSFGCLTLGCSYVRNLGLLDSFIDWTLDLYRNKSSETWKDITQYNVSDMELWTWFLRLHPEWIWNDLCEIKDGGTFDPNLCIVSGWDNDGVSKSIQWTGGKPIGRYAGLDTGLKCLHCWGIWKYRMEALWKLCLSS